MSSPPVLTPDTAIELIDLLGSEGFRAARRGGVESSEGRPTPAGAFNAAQRRYLAGERIDMQALAADLGVSRPTLYRWTGGREQLLGDVLFHLSDELFIAAKRRSSHLHGAERLMSVYRWHLDALVTATPLHTFLQQETHVALRILTARDGSVQMRTVARAAELYREEQHSGAFTPQVDIDTLAYAVVRVTEAFIYNDAIVAVEPEVERAATIVALLLGSG